MKNLFILCVTSILLWGCTPSQETTEKRNDYPSTQGDEVYLFEEADATDTTAAIMPAKVDYVYSIQLGAFASQQIADKFAEKSKKKFGQNIYVKMKEDLQLYAVILGPIETHESAEQQLNQLRAQKDYKDAFILREVKEVTH